MIEAKQEGLRFSMVAGEVSGDLLASLMMRGLIERFDHASFEGIGGPQMNALGFKSLWSYKKLAVRGYVEVYLTFLRKRLKWTQHYLSSM